MRHPGPLKGGKAAFGGNDVEMKQRTDSTIGADDTETYPLIRAMASARVA